MSWYTKYHYKTTDELLRMSPEALPPADLLEYSRELRLRMEHLAWR